MKFIGNLYSPREHGPQSILGGLHSHHLTGTQSSESCDYNSRRISAPSIMSSLYSPRGTQSTESCAYNHRRLSTTSIMNSLHSPHEAVPHPIGTLLFVDGDGVLNVGIEDGGQELVLCPENVRNALAMHEEGAGEARDDDLVEKILATYHREVGHGDATYAEYMISTSFKCCKTLVGRLAQLIQMAGEGCTVVLSSSWRHPQHAKQVHQLEQALSSLLGAKFMFHDRTAPVVDNTPARRLRTIGDFIATKGSKIFRSADMWRVLLLEDFHIHPMDGWLCDGHHISSIAAAEEYLTSKVPADVTALVKIVHTFSSWTTPSGLTVRIGTGLTNEHFCKAKQFLGGSCCVHCTRSFQPCKADPPPLCLPIHGNMEELICI